MRFNKKLGIAQIPILIGLLIMAIALPVASTLVKQTQDTRRGAVDIDSSIDLLSNNKEPCDYGGIQYPYGASWCSGDVREVWGCKSGGVATHIANCADAGKDCHGGMCVGRYSHSRCSETTMCIRDEIYDNKVIAKK